MRAAFRHTGVLMMVAVVALGAVGAGFALWFQVLTFNGTVNTGTLHVSGSADASSEIVCIRGQNGDATSSPATASEPATTANDCQDYGDYQAPAPEKHVVDCTFTADGNGWTLTIDNAFPYAGCQYTADVTNDGTIPVHLDLTGEVFSGAIPNGFVGFHQSNADCELTLSTADGGGTVPVPFPGSGGENEYSSRFVLYGPTGAPTDVQFQLHPGESIACTYRVWLQQTAHEGGTYTFHAYLVARQYNEDQAVVVLPPGPLSNP